MHRSRTYNVFSPPGPPWSFLHFPFLRLCTFELKICSSVNVSLKEHLEDIVPLIGSRRESSILFCLTDVGSKNETTRVMRHGKVRVRFCKRYYYSGYYLFQPILHLHN